LARPPGKRGFCLDFPKKKSVILDTRWRCGTTIPTFQPVPTGIHGSCRKRWRELLKSKWSPSGSFALCERQRSQFSLNLSLRTPGHIWSAFTSLLHASTPLWNLNRRDGVTFSLVYQCQMMS
jgi:hypothetical protein